MLKNGVDLLVVAGLALAFLVAATVLAALNVAAPSEIHVGLSTLVGAVAGVAYTGLRGGAPPPGP